MMQYHNPYHYYESAIIALQESYILEHRSTIWVIISCTLGLWRFVCKLLQPWKKHTDQSLIRPGKLHL